MSPSWGASTISHSLVQVLARSRLAPDVFIVTRGVHAAEPQAVAASMCGSSHGGAWGLARVVRLEHSSLRVACVDALHSSCVAWNPDLLVGVAGVRKEREEAWGASVGAGTGARFVARLRVCQSAACPTRLLLLASGVHAITGGLGGLGLCAAGMLQRAGATGVILSSRSGRALRADQGLHTRLPALCATSAVQLTSVDAVDMAGMCCSMVGARSALAGVLHTAGVLRDKMLRSLAPDDAYHVFAPKALAASHIHRVAACMPVESMGMFSSLSATIGNIGQASYSAANAYLDALARCRREGGSAGSSLQIPAVSGAGMGAAAFDTEQLRSMGALTLDEFACSLSTSLCHARAGQELTQALVARALLESVAAMPAFAELPRTDRSASVVVPARACAHARSSELARAIASLPAGRRQEHTEAMLVLGPPSANRFCCLLPTLATRLLWHAADT
jgi:NADP-dependent 3-hydroxy acid dehydrogenase YdfG